MKNIVNKINIILNITKKIAFISIILAIFSISLLFSEENSDTDSHVKTGFSEKIVVTARLPEEGENLKKIPANVSIITSEEIESSGARTVQELLFEREGILLFDDVGNSVEATVDMRGFNEGTAAAVLLDGVRINEPDDNRVNLEQIPLSSIERIEIHRGSSSSLFGAGALSGTLNIVTKNIPDDGFLKVIASYGSHHSDKESIAGGFRAKNTGILLDLSREASDGFRENGDFDLSNIFIKAGGTYGKIDELTLAFLHNESSLGAPGSLTPEEISQDRFFSPYNKVDGADEKLNQLTLRIKKGFEKLGSISNNLYYRENSIGTLTTGRWLAGFSTESDIRTFGLVSQHQCSFFSAQKKIFLVSGVEAQISSFSSTGFFTDSVGNHSSSVPDSSNETDVSMAALFTQASMDITSMVSLLAAARFDTEDIDYKDLLHSDRGGSTRFSEITFKGGMNINPSDSTGFYFLYSEAFLPPTVYDLFAFPLFGSNPGLEPSQGKNYEVGIRKSWDSLARIHASLFRMDVKNEVVFLITDPISFVGQNENVGKSQRKGLEIYSEIDFPKAVSGFLSYTYMDAELKSGDNRGMKLPLVPESKISAGLAAKLGKRQDLFMRLTGTYVGKQYLTGDESNQWPLLASYTTLNGRISKKWKKLNIFLEAKNLLDEKYVTRGITNGMEVFYTPAPGRRIFAGVEYSTTF